MKLSIFVVAVGVLCIGGVFSPEGSAQEPSFQIGSRTQNSAPTIIVRSIYDFEKSVSLKVRADPTLLPSDVLIRTVSNIGMTDAQGIRITSGFDIDIHNDLVVAFSGGQSEIINARQTPNGLQVIASFKDHNGNFVSPPVGSLAAYTIGGERLCFDYQDVTHAAPKMAFQLLLDRSGSMANVISDVQHSANGFLKGLPPTAECAVASFNGTYTYHTELYQNCNTGNFQLASLYADGGTELYYPLLSAYKSLDHPYFNDHQKAVIVITDGQISLNPALRREVEHAKQNKLTFVYFLGQQEDRYLTGLADAFLQSNANIGQQLAQYFESLSAAYRTQKVLKVQQCTGGHHATP